ncbi:methyl-accepting chemotaxis protein [Chromobacterium haemolyticum]|uniref:methyl-accepting chemotaxis protein n=1 Tax=Chromobacterium haemolyticum TaxID=394935 RepID=UPI0013B3BAC0|nr:methyl-accepting chemotaxis protein [Chromobacterium haemolyticum]
MTTPVVRLMQRLSYPSRFALIGTVFAVALLYMVYGLYRTNQDNIDFSQKERVGVSYIQPLQHLLGTLEQAQDLAVRAAQGEAAAKAALPAAQAQLEQGWNQLQSAHERYGGILQTDEAWKTASAARGTLSRIGGAPPPQVITSFDSTADKLNALLGAASDNSNLTLDPDIDSYYLMDAATTKLPALSNYIGEALAWAAKSEAGQTLTPAERDRLVELRPLINGTLDGLNSDLAKALAYNPSLKNALSAESQALAAFHQGQAAAIDKAITGQTGAALALSGMAAKNAEISSRFSDVTLKNLEALLQARIDRMQAQRNLYIGIGLAAMLLASFLFHQLYLSITLQLGGEPFYVQSVVEQLAAGQLGTRIQLREQDSNSLLASIGKMRDQLRDTVTQLLDTSREVNAAADQMAQSAQNVSHSSTRQTQAAASMAAAIEQLSTSLMVSAEQSEQANQLSRAAVSQSSEGNAIIHNASASMDSIVRDVSSASETIGALGQQSESIASIVDVIRDVADQTNLLALNAAIEAARAGEQGRGFAVVADEVRKLAERTAQSTTEISTIVSDIQRTSQQAITNMQTGMSAIMKGQENTRNAGASIASIRQCVDQVLDSIHQITQGLKEQSNASQSLAQNVESVARMSETNASAVEASAQTAGELQSVSQRLGQLAGRFSV